MADEDLFADVTIRYPATEEERVVNRGAVSGFTNSGWVVLDAAGRVNSRATSAATTPKEN